MTTRGDRAYPLAYRLPSSSYLETSWVLEARRARAFATMAPARRRNARNSTTDTLAILNGINKPVAQRRRHTTNYASINDYPTRSPEPLRMTRRKQPQRRGHIRSKKEPIESDPDYGSQSNYLSENDSSQSNQDRNPELGYEEDKNTDRNGQSNEEEEEEEEGEEEASVDFGDGEESWRTEEGAPEDPDDLVASAHHVEDEPSDNPSAVSRNSPTGRRSQSRLGEQEAGPDMPDQNTQIPERSSPEQEANREPPNVVGAVGISSVRNPSTKTNTGNTIQGHSDQSGDNPVAQQNQPAIADGVDADNLIEKPNAGHSHHESAHLITYEVPQRNIPELDSWFSKEVEKGSFEEPWKFLRDHGRALSSRITGQIPEFLVPAYVLIVVLQNILINSTDLTDHELQEVRNLNDAIYVEVKQVLDFPASASNNSFLASNILFQLEGYLIPELVILIQLSFQVYRKSGDLAFDQLHSNLALLSKCCKHIYDLWNCGYIARGKQRPRSLVLRPSLRRLQEALESGKLKSNYTETGVAADTAPLLYAQWTEPWSLEEEHYLSIALERYEGQLPFVVYWIHLTLYRRQSLFLDQATYGTILLAAHNHRAENQGSVTPIDIRGSIS